MKGTEVTQGQLDHSRQFMCATNNYVSAYRSAEQVAQLLAWYGAIRAKSGKIEPDKANFKVKRDHVNQH